jgi:hypothetical protein
MPDSTVDKLNQVILELHTIRELIVSAMPKGHKGTPFVPCNHEWVEHDGDFYCHLCGCCKPHLED